MNGRTAEAPSIHFIGGTQSDTAALTPAHVGAKAYGLMRMNRAGITVPPAFVLSTGYSRAFQDAGGRLPESLHDALAASVRRLENETGRIFGGSRRPLLLAVRSGAPVSMPGMLDTVLNVGLNRRTVHGLVRMTGNPHLAWDCYRRLLRDYATVIRGLPAAPFDALVASHLDADLCPGERDLDTLALRDIVERSRDLIHDLGARRFDSDPMTQLVEAVEAVFRSWNSERATAYRRLNDIDPALGTAVTVQTMVFGNAGIDSGSGVGFTRNPSTGENALYLDFQFNAQGEDIVSGRGTVLDTERLPVEMPQVWQALAKARVSLESEFAEMQDFEFTVEHGTLYLLQTRSGKRTPWAALRIAVDLVDEGIIDQASALERLAGLDLDTVRRRRLVPQAGTAPIARATAASIGVASGAVALDNERAAAMAQAGRAVILVRESISTDDIAGLNVAGGILTAAGSRTAHAAVVARQMEKVCLVGCPDLRIDARRRRIRIGGLDLAEGDAISIDGSDGAVYAGAVTIEDEQPLEALERVREWRALAGMA